MGTGIPFVRGLSAVAGCKAVFPATSIRGGQGFGRLRILQCDEHRCIAYRDQLAQRNFQNIQVLHALSQYSVQKEFR